MTYFQVVMAWLKHWQKEMSEAGYDQTWNNTDDLRITTCRLTCGFVRVFGGI
jgi:hypothetical protein